MPNALKRKEPNALDRNFGLRTDGTPKGMGWLGVIPMGDGREMTELSIGVGIGGRETLIPSLVPTLSTDEIEYLRGGGDPRKNKVIMNKAIEHAMPYIHRGESPFK